MSGNNDDQKLPEVARRRGNADTLFSADWFEDEDEGGDAPGKEDAPSISAPAMYEPPAPAVKPSTPPAAPPQAPPPPKRLSNPTILPDFDMDDDEPAPPPVAAPKPSAPETPADDSLPDVAKRRGNADTLFSADWFDDDEKAEGDAPNAPAPPAAKPAPVSKAAAAEPEATGGNRTLMLVGAGAVLLILACGGIATGLGIVMMMKG